MSNKKETPVSWLVDKLKFIDKNSYNELYEHFDHALQMESQKQQKYDEMLVVLEKVVQSELTPIVLRRRAEEIIKEAKEL
jgi:hypothetical protein